MELYETKPNDTPNQMQMLIRYKAWANALVFKSVMALPEEEIVKERLTLFKSIVHTLNHVYVVDDIFKAHLTGQSHSYTARNTDTSPPIDILWQATQEMDRWYIEFTDSLSEADLCETIEFEFVGGGEGAMTRQDILLHIVNHGTYHRGFVGDMMYQVPSRLMPNDLPVFLRDVWAKAAVV